jgi:glucokinase
MLYPGANGFAGEFGHLNIDRSADAPLCACGQRGCVEAFAGTKAVQRKYKELSGIEVDEVRPIAEAARKGNKAALTVFTTMGEALGRGLAAVQNLLDLNAIIFTGGIAAALDMVEPHLRSALRSHTFAPPLAEVPLLSSELGERAGIIGAAYLTTL